MIGIVIQITDKMDLKIANKETNVSEISQSITALELAKEKQLSFLKGLMDNKNE